MSVSSPSNLRSAVLLAGVLLLCAACGTQEQEQEQESGRVAPTTEAQEINPTFEIRPMVAIGDHADAQPTDPDGVVVEELIPHVFAELGPVAVGADGVHSASAVQVDDRWVVEIQFNDEGNRAFEEVTAEAACAETPAGDRIAFLLEEGMIGSSTVSIECGASMSGTAQIYGGSSNESAEALARQIAND